MNGPQHYQAAEQAMEESRLCTTAGGSRMWLQKAAIHAQLAYTAVLVGLTAEDEDRAWRDILGAGAGQEKVGRLVPEDTCGSWIDGRRCILRPGHDEPCLPYRIPAEAPAGPASRDDGDLGQVLP